ncbi:sigma-70 family RNA polymerase sigma factor [Candidatus Nomurabacteria bacterium]|nr:sigma-70 family RNA polymerase sigma factor [Candidatus Nomurabacteria bacterium]
MTNQEALELVNQTQDGEVESFARLYDYYFPKIYQFIYYQVRHRESSEDLTSLTFTKALEKINSFKTKDGLFSAWLYRIARNTVTDHWRTKKEDLELKIAMDKISQEQTEKNLDQKQLLEKVSRQLNLLKSKQKEIIIMRLWQELSYQEISQILNKSEASCKMYFSRSIKILRESLSAWLLLFINFIN